MALSRLSRSMKVRCDSTNTDSEAYNFLEARQPRPGLNRLGSLGTANFARNKEGQKMWLKNFALAALLVASPQTVFGQVSLGDPSEDHSGTPVQPGDVYGEAKFKLVADEGEDVTALVSELLQAIIE